MATVNGVGVVWGVAGVSYSGFGSPLVQSVNANRTAKRKEILDGNGNLVGNVFFDQRITLSTNVVPSSTTLALAKSNMNACMPAIGTLVTVTDLDSTVTDGSNSGKYTLIDVKLNRTNTEPASIEFELEQSEVNDATAAITS